MPERDAATAVPQTHLVDQVFGALAYANQQDVALPAAPIFQTAAPSAAPCQPTDLTAEYEWMREERKRIEAYTLHQFGTVSQQREQLLSKRAEVEAEFALREQEMNRKMKLLADRSDAVALRERHVAEAEASLTVERETLAAAEKQLQQHQQTSVKLHKDVELQRLLLEQVRFQTIQLQEAARAAQAELEAFERMLRSSKSEGEKDLALFTQRAQKLEEREQALVRAEESMRRREAEQDQLEAQLRCEIEERERQLALEQREIVELRARLRDQTAAASYHESGATSLRMVSRPRQAVLAVDVPESDDNSGDTIHG